MRILVFIITILSTINLEAGEMEQALRSYENGQFTDALPLFENLATKDNADAQYHLAFMYFNGDGVAQDDQLAARWFEKAAKNGHASAQDTLAYMYLNGRGLEPDPIQAYAWYSLAAENGIFLARNIINMLEQQLKIEDVLLGKIAADEYRLAIER